VEKEGGLAQSQEYIHTGYDSEKYANLLHQRRLLELFFGLYVDENPSIVFAKQSNVASRATTFPTQ
jgi:hypothetical protein